MPFYPPYPAIYIPVEILPGESFSSPIQKAKEVSNCFFLLGKTSGFSSVAFYLYDPIEHPQTGEAVIQFPLEAAEQLVYKTTSNTLFDRFLQPYVDLGLVAPVLITDVQNAIQAKKDSIISPAVRTAKFCIYPFLPQYWTDQGKSLEQLEADGWFYFGEGINP